MKTVEIAFGIDRNFVMPMIVTINSIVANRQSDYVINFHVLHSDLLEIDKQIVKNFVSKISNINVIYHNVKELMQRDNITISSTYKRLTLSVYTRLYIPQLFSEFNKILYLDVDLVVLEDIALLYDTDINNYAVATVTPDGHRYIYEHNQPLVPSSSMQETLKANGVKLNRDNTISIQDYFVKYLKLQKPSEYFNAGVMLINPKFINDNGFTKKLSELINKEYMFNDQDILNIAFENSNLQLDKSWNVFSELKKNESDSKTYIIHYNGPNKPWLPNRYNIDCNLNHIYYLYAKDIIDYSIFYTQNNNSTSKLLTRLVKKYLPNNIVSKIKIIYKKIIQ